MVLDVQHNALSARVSFKGSLSIYFEGVAQVQHSEGLGSPCRIRVPVLEAIKGVAPSFAAREGLGVLLIGGG